MPPSRRRAAAPGEPEAGEQRTGQVGTNLPPSSSSLTSLSTTAEVIEGEIVEYDVELDVIAGQVREAQQRFVAAGTVAVEAYFEIGHCLERARALMRSDQGYGEWFRAQEFGFTLRWAHVLRSAAEREPEVRAAVGTQVLTGQAPNIKKALAAVRNPEPAPRDPVLDLTLAELETQIELGLATIRRQFPHPAFTDGDLLGFALTLANDPLVAS